MSALMLSKPVCIQCGICCANLSWDQRIKISLSTKSIMLSKVCKFLEIQDEFRSFCSIHDNKPNVCKKLHCGVSVFMDELIGADMFDWKEVGENAG